MAPSLTDRGNSSDSNDLSHTTDRAINETILRLAELSPLKYDQTRKKEADALSVRATVLDQAVKEARKKGGIDTNLPFSEVSPWPEEVNPAEILADVTAVVRRFIVCDKEISVAVALWCAMTWFIEVVQVCPLAVITAPEKRCGKSQLLALLGRLVCRPITASNISPAALYRAIDAWKPTLLIDEVDACMKDNEELRGIINSGHTRDSAYVIRTVGDTFTPTKFSTWGPKALSGIGHVADTLMDRAIILELRRKLSHENVDRLRYAEPELFENLAAKLSRFAIDYSEKVRQAMR
jgi:putative DNA primase/helicase